MVWNPSIANVYGCQTLRLTSINWKITCPFFSTREPPLSPDTIFRTKPLDTYLARFPLPTESSQPPRQPLLIGHPLRDLFAIGMLGTCADRRAFIERSFSLLPKSDSGAYQLAGDGYIFVTDGSPEPKGDHPRPSWYAVDPKIHVSSIGCISRDKAEPLRDWAGDCILQETGSSPLLTVRHEVRVTLFCTYDVEGDPFNRVAARLRFTVPILFNRVGKRPQVPELSPSLPPRSGSSCSSQSSTSTASSTSSYFVHALPAYSQLFEPNGDRKIDYSLPSYSQCLEPNTVGLPTF